MPTCLASSSGLLRSSTQQHSSVVPALVRSARRACRVSSQVRHASTTSGLPAQHEKQRAHTLTVLHKTKALLPRILPRTSPSPDGVSLKESLTFWEEVLGKMYEDLTLPSEKREEDRVRIVVYGMDETSGADELVTALLQDPFASQEQKEILQSRWQARPQGSRTVRLQYGTSPCVEDDVVYVQSSWLQNFGVPLEVTEFSSPPSALSPNSQSANALFTADVPIVLCNPVSVPLPSILPASIDPTLPISRENTILAITSSSPSLATAAGLTSRLTASLPKDSLRVVFVDPARALHGLEMLKDGVASPIAVQRYQDDVSGSNVSSITHSVKDILSRSLAEPKDGTSPSARVLAVHTETSRALIKDALATCRAVLHKADLEADAVLTGTSTLRSQIEEAKAKVHLEVFGPASGGKDGDEIAKAVALAKKHVQPTLDALQWYKLFWRVDDVREVVTAAVDRAWCRDLERKLVFHAGRLAALQASFTDSANALCRSYPPTSAYHSPVLLNSLARIASTPSYPLPAMALTDPLHARQRQLGFPTERLHVSAQRAVVGMSGSVLGGLSVAWAGWATELQLLGGMVDIGMSSETALGVGLLSAAAGVRWAVGRWERAKRRWWKDWDRIGQGLERDLQGALVHTMDERVVVVPETVCTGLETLVTKRKAEVEELEEEVQSLEANIR